MNKDLQKRAKDILSKMTLKEKIGQLTQISLLGMTEEVKKEVVEKVRKGEIGSIILCSSALAGNEEGKFGEQKTVIELQKAAMESRNGIPLIFGRDVIHGHKVVYPISLAMSASFNFELVEKAYANIADEALCDGINWTFTPMLDLCRDPRWGRIIEGPGEDPYVGEQMAKAIVSGIQGTGDTLKMAACAKHYIGYGASEGGRDYHKTEISDYTLRNYYLKAFKSAVDSGVATVMSSFNEISGQPTSSSKYLLTDVLRGELGFEGFVISDWGAVGQLEQQGVAEDAKDSARLAINAGLDMDMVDNCFFEHLEELLSEGKVDIETIDTAVLRVLYIKLLLGLFEKPPISQINYSISEHMQTAYELSKECMVLLKNKDNILPLDKTKSVAMAGPLLNEKRHIFGSWSLDGDESLAVTICDGIKNANENAFEYNNFDYTNIKKFRECDTVILALGESYTVSGEARSLSNIELDDSQKSLIKHMQSLGKKIIAVISAGRPLALGDVEKDLDAILYVWHGGTQTGNAVSDIIFGDCSPSGRLPVTFPRVTGQIPIYYNCPPSGRDCNEYYKETTDIRNYENCSGSPLYPFGYGLSYTEFKYSNITTRKTEYTIEEAKNGIECSVEVSNVGNYDSKEVVQLYIRDNVASMTRPIRELKGTKKIFIKKGEVKKVIFTLTYDDFAFYNAEGKLSAEPGTFDIFIGDNSLTPNVKTIKLI